VEPIDDDPLSRELEHLHHLAQALAGAGRFADDAAQDTMLTALSQRDAPLQRLRAWLSTVLRHRLQRLARREAQRAEVERQRARPEALPGSDDIAASAELHRRLADEVAALDEPYRTAVVLRFFRDLPTATVAQQTEVPVETARTRIKRGLARLRQRLNQRYGGAAWVGLLGGVPRESLFVTTTIAMSLKPLVVGAAAVLAIAALALLPFSERFSAPDATSSEPVAIARTAAATPATSSEQPPAARAVLAAAPTAPDAACVLRGRVVAAQDGRAVANAQVRLQISDADEFACLDDAYRSLTRELADVSTDQDGRFEFTVERARLHRLAAQAAGFAPATLIGCAGGTDVTIELPTTKTLRGLVRSAPGPVAHAVVRVMTGHGTVESTSTADGRFAIAELPATRVLVAAHADGLAPQHCEVDLRAEADPEVTFELEVGRVVRGIVRDGATKAPVVGAEIRNGPTGTLTTRSDAQGRYVLTALDHRSTELHVTAAGYAPHGLEVESVSAEPTIDIDLRRGHHLRGRLVDDHGVPVADAYVCAAAHFHSASLLHTEWRRGDVHGNGRFRIEGVRGAGQLMVRAPGRGVRLYDLPRSQPDGAELDLGDLVLYPAGGLEGRVVDATGAPVAHAKVSLQGTNRDCSTLFAHLSPPLPEGSLVNPSEIFHFQPTARRAGPDGAFRFAGLAAGDYRVVVEATDRPSTTAGPFAVVDGAVHAGVEVVVAAERVIAGRVELPPGLAPDAVRQVIVTACDQESQQHESARLATDGTFRIGGLTGERYTLSSLECPRGYVLAVAREVAVGARDVVLRLLPAAQIRGRVVDADGNAVRTLVNARVMPPIAYMSKNYETDADGRFTLDVAPDFVGEVRASTGNPLVDATAEGVVAGTDDLVLTIHDRSRR
jgi:RNA polymerase sigma-70 factor (ECF subfamily)